MELVPHLLRSGYVKGFQGCQYRVGKQHRPPNCCLVLKKSFRKSSVCRYALNPTSTRTFFLTLGTAGQLNIEHRLQIVLQLTFSHKAMRKS